MNRSVVHLIMATSFLLGIMGRWPQAGDAESLPFSVAASLPQATGIEIHVSHVAVTDNSFALVHGTALEFGPMTFDTKNNRWIGDHAFSIDVTPAGGVGIPDVYVNYASGSNPNSPGPGLESHMIVTFARLAGEGKTLEDRLLAAHGPRKVLSAVKNEHVAPTDLGNGFLRMYLGLATGAQGEPAGSTPFTKQDKPGDYDCTFSISATLM